MRILFVTARYPPSLRGWGYMRICEQVADGLHALGHEVEVLTSTHSEGSARKPYPVHRKLHLDPDWDDWAPVAWQFFVGRRKRERQDRWRLQRRVDEFRPQVIFVWHANNLSRAMLQQAEQTDGVETIYYFANYLPEHPDEYVDYWRSSPQSLAVGLIKRSLAAIALRMLAREGKPIRLRYPHSISVSDYVRDRLSSKGLISDDAVVIPNGVDIQTFSPSTRNGRRTDPVRALVAGRIAPEKGIHTLLQGLIRLKSQGAAEGLTVTILGHGPAEYQKRLERLVNEHGLNSIVTFEAPVPHNCMPEVLADHNFLIMPSEWDEPMACILLEAMASRLLVLGTPTGGTPQVLADMDTGLVFRAGDADQLADKLAMALDRSELAHYLAVRGHRRVEREFSIESTVEGVEVYLDRIIAAARVAA